MFMHMPQYGRHRNKSLKTAHEIDNESLENEIKKKNTLPSGSKDNGFANKKNDLREQSTANLKPNELLILGKLIWAPQRAIEFGKNSRNAKDLRLIMLVNQRIEPTHPYVPITSKKETKFNPWMYFALPNTCITLTDTYGINKGLYNKPDRHLVRRLGVETIHNGYLGTVAGLINKETLSDIQNWLLKSPNLKNWLLKEEH